MSNLGIDRLLRSQEIRRMQNIANEAVNRLALNNPLGVSSLWGRGSVRQLSRSTYSKCTSQTNNGGNSNCSTVS